MSLLLMLSLHSWFKVEALVDVAVELLTVVGVSLKVGDFIWELVIVYLLVAALQTMHGSLTIKTLLHLNFGQGVEEVFVFGLHGVFQCFV